MARLLLCFGLLASTSYAYAQPSPVFYWKLDGTSGTIAVESESGSNGTLVGGTQWDPTGGHHQGAARFDGVDDRIVLGTCDLTNGGGAISISLWIKPDFVTGMERTLIAKTVGPTMQDHVWSIALINGTALRFRLKAAGTTSEVSTPPSSLFGGTWYHMVAVYDGAEMRLYTNGSLMASGAKSGSIGYHPQAPASLGATSSGTEPFSGWIDDVRIYNAALADAEILDILFETFTTGISESDMACEPASLATLASKFERMTITDNMGRNIIDRSRANSTLELPQLSAGLYLVCLQGRDERKTVRLAVP
ncbi:MAG: LamG domain-containing protein [Flavobacteriales bacterium]|nr:LamG domain-containing protein [Flavobacteriales bacterium]